MGILQAFHISFGILISSCLWTQVGIPTAKPTTQPHEVQENIPVAAKQREIGDALAMLQKYRVRAATLYMRIVAAHLGFNGETSNVPNAKGIRLHLPPDNVSSPFDTEKPLLLATKQSISSYTQARSLFVDNIHKLEKDTLASLYIKSKKEKERLDAKHDILVEKSLTSSSTAKRTIPRRRSNGNSQMKNLREMLFAVRCQQIVEEDISSQIHDVLFGRDVEANQQVRSRGERESRGRTGSDLEARLQKVQAESDAALRKEEELRHRNREMEQARIRREQEERNLALKRQEESQRQIREAEEARLQREREEQSRDLKAAAEEERVSERSVGGESDARQNQGINRRTCLWVFFILFWIGAGIYGNKTGLWSSYKDKCGRRSAIFQAILVIWTVAMLLSFIWLAVEIESVYEKDPALQAQQRAGEERSKLYAGASTPLSEDIGESFCTICGIWLVVALPLGIAAIATLQRDSQGE